MITTFGAVAALACATPPAPTPLVTATSPRARATAILRKASTPGRQGPRWGAAIGGDVSATHPRDRALRPQSRHGPPALGPFGVAVVESGLRRGGRDGGGAGPPLTG